MSKTVIQRGLFGADYSASISRISCHDDDDEYICPNCEETVERDECIENPEGDPWCQDCIDTTYIYCEHCDSMADADDSEQVSGSFGRYGSIETQTWCESCTDRHATKCGDCGDYMRNEDCHSLASAGSICQGCYENDYFTCEDCCEIYPCDQHNCVNDGSYCDGCAPAGEDFTPNGFRNCSGSLTEIGSARCYGIELETDECDGYHELEDSPAWGAKDDCTVGAKEFYSDILSGDDGLASIRAWAKVADGNGWQTGSDCGYHLHLDVRGDSDDQRFAIAFAYRATQAVWLAFVENHRRYGSYSHEIRWNCADLAQSKASGRSFDSFARQHSRYNWANCYSYNQHGTIEIRSHQGTRDECEIINWVKAHTRFADWAATKGYDGVVEALVGLYDSEKFDLIAREAWQGDDLREYYNEKAERYTDRRF